MACFYSSDKSNFRSLNECNIASISAIRASFYLLTTFDMVEIYELCRIKLLTDTAYDSSAILYLLLSCCYDWISSFSTPKVTPSCTFFNFCGLLQFVIF